MFRKMYALPMLLLGFGAKAQVSDTAIAAVRYSFSHLSDTTMPPDTENMILYLGKKYTVYKSYDRIVSDSALKDEVKRAEATAAAGGTISINMGRLKRGSGSAVYKEVNTGKIQRIESFMQNYLIDEEPPVIDWNVLPDTKTIQALNCQKATTRFRGRNYTVWFTTQLPYSSGPWKLGGLPGLIVEAADDEGQVQFKFAGYENVEHRKIPIELPEGPLVKSTDKAYRQLRESADKDPQGFMRSRMAEMQNSGGGSFSGGVSVSGVGSGRSSGTPSRRRQLNNPIERTPN